MKEWKEQLREGYLDQEQVKSRGDRWLKRVVSEMVKTNGELWVKVVVG